MEDNNLSLKKYIEAINNDNMCNRFLLQIEEGLQHHYEFTDLYTGFCVRVWDGEVGCRVYSFFNAAETILIREVVSLWVDRSKKINSLYLEAIEEEESRNKKFYFDMLYGGEDG